jgi:hypothetical protein
VARFAYMAFFHKKKHFKFYVYKFFFIITDTGLPEEGSLRLYGPVVTNLQTIQSKKQLDNAQQFLAVMDVLSVSECYYNIRHMQTCNDYAIIIVCVG